MKWSDDEDSQSAPELETLDISNDKYYQPAAGFEQVRSAKIKDLQIPFYGSKTIQHSLPAYDLWRPFYPTHLSDEKLQNFHRPKLRHFNLGPQSLTKRRSARPWYPVKNLSRNIFKCQKKLRTRVIDAINRGFTREEIIKTILSLHQARDLTAKNGDLVLFEYSEEFPPVLSERGMSTNVKTYHMLAGSKESPQVESSSEGPAVGYQEKISDLQKARHVYFNSLKPGSSCRVLENNLFRAPIFEHMWNENDFLVIRTRNNFYIRSIGAIFTVGQTMPLAAIPQPNQNSITKFRANLSNFYINKELLASDPSCPSLDFERLLKLFPDYQRSNLLKRLRAKGGDLQGSVKNRRFAFPNGLSTTMPRTLKELRASFTPEQYCLNMSMLAARQRLRDLNYTESMIYPPDSAEVETEVLAAPWNTSKAVLETIAEKSYLDLHSHLLDPTGAQREGFSCVSWTKSPTEQKQKEAQSAVINQAKSQSNAKEVQMKNPLISQIRKEKLERLAIFNRESQLIADVQAQVLASKEELSSGEEEDIDSDQMTDGENLLDTSFDEQLRDLDRMIVGGRTDKELNYEKEEEERHRMMKEFQVNETMNISRSQPNPPPTSTCDNQQARPMASYKNKVLKITRTYDTDDGLIMRTEVVREPKIIALYDQKKGINGLSNGRHIDRRMSMSTLEPTELCRADGIVLTISKKVLDLRAMRRVRRNSEQTIK